MKNEDFLKNSQNWPLGGAPGSGGQKLYQKVLLYAERVLLSKFGENRMKKKDFLKNAKNWPPGGTPEGGGQNFFEHFSLNTVMVHLCKFREDSAQETRVFSQIIAKEKEKKEKKNSSGFETLLRRVKKIGQKYI